MNKFQTLMSLTRIKKVKKVVTEVVTEVVTDRQTGFAADLKAKKEAKDLRRQAFLKHKSEGGGDYTRVKNHSRVTPILDEINE